MVCNTDMEHQTVTFGVTCVPFSFGGQALLYLGRPGWQVVLESHF